jgi:hypothetical protein
MDVKEGRKKELDLLSGMKFYITLFVVLFLLCYFIASLVLFQFTFSTFARCSLHEITLHFPLNLSILWEDSKY